MAPLTKHDVGAITPVYADTLDDSPGLTLKASSAGLFYGCVMQNTAAAITYIQFHDKATLGAVTLGSTVPTFVFGIAASGSLAIFFETPIKFVNGLQVFSTTTQGGSSAAITNGTFLVA